MGDWVKDTHRSHRHVKCQLNQLVHLDADFLHLPRTHAEIDDIHPLQRAPMVFNHRIQNRRRHRDLLRMTQSQTLQRSLTSARQDGLDGVSIQVLVALSDEDGQVLQGEQRRPHWVRGSGGSVHRQRQAGERASGQGSSPADDTEEFSVRNLEAVADLQRLKVRQTCQDSLKMRPIEIRRVLNQ